VYLSHHPEPKRKLAYTWEMIQVDGVWVGINTSLPNRLVDWGLERGWFPQLAGFSRRQREVTCGRSKIDFLLMGDSGLAYLEVKNTTWAVGSRALFPDTVTTRGQKHLEDLIEIRRQGQRALLLYWINRADCTEFAPGEERDPRLCPSCFVRPCKPEWRCCPIGSRFRRQGSAPWVWPKSLSKHPKRKGQALWKRLGIAYNTAFSRFLVFQALEDHERTFLPSSSHCPDFPSLPSWDASPADPLGSLGSAAAGAGGG